MQEQKVSSHIKILAIIETRKENYVTWNTEDIWKDFHQLTSSDFACKISCKLLQKRGVGIRRKKEGNYPRPFVSRKWRTGRSLTSIRGAKAGPANCAFDFKYFDAPEIWSRVPRQTPPMSCANIYGRFSLAILLATAAGRERSRRCYAFRGIHFFRIKIKLNQGPRVTREEWPAWKITVRLSAKKGYYGCYVPLAGIVNLFAPPLSFARFYETQTGCSLRPTISLWPMSTWFFVRYCT